MPPLGKLLIIAGAALIAAGLLVALAPKIPYLGKLPGDIFIRKEGFSLYFPIASSIALSALITLILNIALRK
ncbi:MAG: DUF2905 domain-containing protein [Deltaproteobacteria bacterium]